MNQNDHGTTKTMKIYEGRKAKISFPALFVVAIGWFQVLDWFLNLPFTKCPDDLIGEPLGLCGDRVPFSVHAIFCWGPDLCF